MTIPKLRDILEALDAKVDTEASVKIVDTLENDSVTYGLSANQGKKLALSQMTPADEVNLGIMFADLQIKGFL